MRGQIWTKTTWRNPWRAWKYDKFNQEEMVNSLAKDFTYYVLIGRGWTDVFMKTPLIRRDISSWKQALKTQPQGKDQDLLMPLSCSLSLTILPSHGYSPLSPGCYRGPGIPSHPPPGWLLCPVLVFGASDHGYGDAGGSAGPMASEPPHKEFYVLERRRRSIEKTPLAKWA